MASLALLFEGVMYFILSEASRTKLRITFEDILMVPFCLSAESKEQSEQIR
jgi:hypothetical protein